MSSVKVTPVRTAEGSNSIDDRRARLDAGIAGVQDRHRIQQPRKQLHSGALTGSLYRLKLQSRRRSNRDVKVHASK